MFIFSHGRIKTLPYSPAFLKNRCNDQQRSNSNDQCQTATEEHSGRTNKTCTYCSRVKREQPKSKAKLRPPGAVPETVESIPQQVSQPKVAETGTKDDAYALFMKEMQGLL